MMEMNREEYEVQIERLRHQREADSALFNEHVDELSDNLCKSEQKCENYEIEIRQLRSKVSSLQSEVAALNEQLENNENREPVSPQIVVKEVFVKEPAAAVDDALLERFEQLQKDFDKTLAEKEELVAQFKDFAEESSAALTSAQEKCEGYEDKIRQLTTKVTSLQHQISTFSVRTGKQDSIVCSNDTNEELNQSQSNKFCDPVYATLMSELKKCKNKEHVEILKYEDHIKKVKTLYDETMTEFQAVSGKYYKLLKGGVCACGTVVLAVSACASVFYYYGEPVCNWLRDFMDVKEVGMKHY